MSAYGNCKCGERSYQFSQHLNEWMCYECMEARVKGLEEMILDLGHCPICGWRKDICEHASKWQATGGAK